MHLYSKLAFALILSGTLAASAQNLGPPSSGGGSPTGAAGGGLTGTYPNPTVATNANLTGDVTSVGNATTYNNVVPAAKGGAGTISGALKGSGAGVVTQAACADLSNGSGACAQTYTATTWTPTITGSSTAGTGQTYTIQVGSYEQIGRQVTVRFHLAMSSAGTAAGNVQVSGFPVTSGNTSNDIGTCSFAFMQLTGTSPPTSGLIGLVNPNTSFAALFSNAAVSSALTITQLGNGELVGICNYHT